MAVKKIFTQDKKSKKQALSEAETLGKLEHDYIIKFFGFFTSSIHTCLIFEPARCNLDEYLENRDENFSDLRLKIDIKKALLNITEGLNYMHRQNFFHLDLKPVNILIVEKEFCAKAVIADFDKSKENLNPSRYRTITGNHYGTIVRYKKYIYIFQFI